MTFHPSPAPYLLSGNIPLFLDGEKYNPPTPSPGVTKR